MDTLFWPKQKLRRYFLIVPLISSPVDTARYLQPNVDRIKGVSLYI